MRRDDPNSKAFWWMVDNGAANEDIMVSASQILKDSIERKTDICSRLHFDGQQWLGLLNDYALCDAQGYKVALSKLALNHCFDKIFLVSDAGTVDCLM